MSKDLKSVKTVFFNNTDTVKLTFMLSSYGAEHMVEQIVNCLTLKACASHSCNTVDGELALKVTNSDLALIKKLNGVTYTYNLAFENPYSFRQELM